MSCFLTRENSSNYYQSMQIRRNGNENVVSVSLCLLLLVHFVRRGFACLQVVDSALYTVRTRPWDFLFVKYNYSIPPLLKAKHKTKRYCENEKLIKWALGVEAERKKLRSESGGSIPLPSQDRVSWCCSEFNCSTHSEIRGNRNLPRTNETGGGSNFCSRRGEGYRKIALKNLQNRLFLQKVQIFSKNI